MDFVEAVEPGGMAVTLSDDHGHRLWMLRRSRDAFAPAGYQDLVPLGRALFVELSPLIGDEVPNASGPRFAVSRARARGVEFCGFVSLFTKRTTDRGQLMASDQAGLNLQPAADAAVIRALDWLTAGSKTRMLVLATGKPQTLFGPLARERGDRLDWLLDQAEGRGLRPQGWLSTGDKWPCITDDYGTKAGRFTWL